jgi:hypothetical protein
VGYQAMSKAVHRSPEKIWRYNSIHVTYGTTVLVSQDRRNLFVTLIRSKNLDRINSIVKWDTFIQYAEKK